MKIGIISDTHDNIIMIEKAVELFNKEKVDLVMHAGDHVAPFTALVWERLKSDFLGVYGNNDGDKAHLKKMIRKVGNVYERPHEFIIEGKKILMMHEPDDLDQLVKSEEYDIIIYGHTHRQKIYKEGKTQVINPGEGCGWISGKATAVIFDTTTNEIESYLLGKNPIQPLAD
ncbi:MAG: metallophosphoesterase [Vulcanimicrobiota bacterium]